MVCYFYLEVGPRAQTLQRGVVTPWSGVDNKVPQLYATKSDVETQHFV